VRRVPLRARDAKEAGSLEAEAQAAASLGLPASLQDAADLSFALPAEKLLRFANQAQFDPMGYLRGLVGLLPSQVRVFETSRVTEVETGDILRLAVNGHRVSARHAVIATQLPVVGDGSFYMKAFPFAHPVAAAPLPDGPAIAGMFKSVGSPSHSFRTTERDGRRYLIAAGPEFKTGKPEAQAEAVADLRAFLKDRFGIAEPTHLWINEDFRAMDGAAFVGPATHKTPNLLVATGFDAWGITQGAVAGEILAAAIQEREHPAAALFDATRVKPISGGPTFLKEGTAAGLKLARDKLWGGASGSVDDIPPGGARVISRKGETLAVRRDSDGRLHAVSAVCTHMGCLVAWNEIDRTWDCACHGSRFEADGTVLSGPATAPLETRDASDAEN
jgi:Rieske Fe-S protein